MTIELANGNVAKIDAEDYERVSAIHWHIDDAGYARTNIWSDGKKTSAPRMHRFILQETDRKTHIDHINGDKLDNRKNNLRVCSNSANLMNRGKQSNNSSGYKGVVFDKSRSKWKAEIGFNKKRKFLGRFHTIEEAALAYNDAAVLYHGEFAHINEI
ncbi:AP2 domain-containing protein [Psychrobacillus sp. OK032]|uniref:HNH endonuclease n=1 Tax=Psychrobacillus sp. OK032 TaxID=1884358 RepID=UPI002100ECB8|nr:AP2 domain-containing protein [Psychrobacillus sp. OK032]